MPEPRRRKIRRKITRTTKTTIERKPQKTGEMKVSPFEQPPTSPRKEEPPQEPELEEAPAEEVGEGETRPSTPKTETRAEGAPKEPAADITSPEASKTPEEAPGSAETTPKESPAKPKEGVTRPPETKVAGKEAKDIGKKAVGGGAKKGLKGAGSKAGSAAAKAAGQVASKIGMALAPYLAPIGIGCAIIAAIIGLVFLVVGCSGKLGTTPHQESTEKLETEAAAYMGDIASQGKYSADLTSEMLELFNNPEIAEKISEGDLKIINDLLENIERVPPTQKAQLESLTSQLNDKLKSIFDQLGIYIPPTPSHLDKLGKSTITRAAIDIGSRVLLFLNPKGEVLGFAPIYFGKTGDSKPDILGGDKPDITIIEVLDSGTDSEFIDYSGRKCGRFILKLSGWSDEMDTDFRIIGSSLEDKIITKDREIRVLYATGGDLRMFSSDLSALAPYLNNLPIPVTFK